jgi:glycosyltransferase involved in cell wall biosynthesis
LIKVRIIHLVNHCNHSHGNAHVAIDLACMQAQNGHEVVYASGGGDYLDLFAKYGVRHELIVQNSGNPLQLAASLLRLQRLCFSFRPDVLHAHMMAGAVFGYLTSLISQTPLVTTVHNSFDKHSILMRLGDHVVAVSEAERQSLLKSGYKAARLSVVINGPNHSPRDNFFANRATDAVKIEKPCVVTVCGLHKRKGVNDLIRGFSEAATQLPDWRLYIVGQGPDRQILLDLADELGVTKKISFLGSVGNPAGILLQSDIFVLASYADPCSLAIGEAREAGCAIVATAVDGTPELLEFGEAGKLVEPGSPKQIAAELRQLMTDPTTLRDWRARSLRGSEYFRVSRVAKDYEQVYSSVMSKRHGFLG